jgi:hypothetical protein
LDSIPSHLLTPFNGPIPPSNVLDQLARSIFRRSSPHWAHSIRSTRAKLLEIAKLRALPNASSSPVNLLRKRKSHTQENSGTDTEMDSEENDDGHKPLYRKNSMDFIPAHAPELSSITRLSNRLQRTDRLLPTSTQRVYHPYARASPPPSPDGTSGRPAIRRLRSASSASISQSQPSPTAVPPRMIQTRLRRADSFTHPVALKRAPSFGSSSTPLPPMKEEDTHNSMSTPTFEEPTDDEKKRAKRPKTEHKRNPSFLGAELPPISASPTPPVAEIPEYHPPRPATPPVITPPRKRTARPTATTSESTSGPSRSLRRIGTRDFAGVGTSVRPSTASSSTPSGTSSLKSPFSLKGKDKRPSTSGGAPMRL